MSENKESYSPLVFMRGHLPSSCVCRLATDCLLAFTGIYRHLHPECLLGPTKLGLLNSAGPPDDTANIQRNKTTKDQNITKF
ncbi:hypothetical protein NPIL_438291 [Nephila pilipes]|uniref:Uncharacterized protein n=1 Tax=Nephila pilipes TaxID=299642 RepID=A0A8X6U6Z6_NEPPI|nr:hypothetical protein NPIL_438291 [Nephila pilipes]